MTSLGFGVRRAAFAAAGVGMAYEGYRFYSTSPFVRAAYAESPPSDAKAALQKQNWKGFTELKLQSSEMVNHNVKRLTFALPTEDTVTGISPVTSMLTRHTPDGAFIPVFRPYTPVSDNDVPGTMTFMVKRYPGGKGSGKMHSLVPGDTMRFKPLEEFKYEPNSHNSILLIAGGSGITPLYQLTRSILKNPADKTKLSLVYANNTEEDILLKKEFEELEQKFPERFQKVFVVQKPPQGSDYESGYVSQQMLSRVWPGKQAGQKVLVSGPPPMVEAIAGAKGMGGWTQGSIGGILKDMGYTSEEVHKF